MQDGMDNTILIHDFIVQQDAAWSLLLYDAAHVSDRDAWTK